MRYIYKNDVITILNYSGRMMIIVGIMFLIPIIVDLIYLEFNLINYIIPAIISIGLGFIFDKGLDNHKRSMNLKHAMVISAFIWLWACFIGAISVTLITHLDFASSIFENMSALTGTGITMFSDVESLPYSVLFLRSFEQWVGGLGVIILVIGVMSKPGTSSSKLYNPCLTEIKIINLFFNLYLLSLNI